MLSEKALEERGFRLGLRGEGLTIVVLKIAVTVDNLIDDTPIRQSAEVAVIDVEVGSDLATCRTYGSGFRDTRLLLGEVGIDGIELQPALTTEVDGVLQEFALTDGPENENVVLLLQLKKRADSEGALTPYLGIAMFHYGPIKIYGNGHKPMKS